MIDNFITTLSTAPLFWGVFLLFVVALWAVNIWHIRNAKLERRRAQWLIANPLPDYPKMMPDAEFEWALDSIAAEEQMYESIDKS